MVSATATATATQRLTGPVPDFFQEADEAALRQQVQWAKRELKMDDAFFARMLGITEEVFTDWMNKRSILPDENQARLREFWQMMLHLLSFQNFDLERVNRMLDQTSQKTPEASSVPCVPPWLGSSMRRHLEKGGEAVVDVNEWVTAFRFGELYSLGYGKP